MESPGPLDRLRSSPVARRIVFFAFAAGIAAIAWYSLTRSPVESGLALDLVGDWPAVRSVTFTYQDPGSLETLREKKLHPAPGSTSRTFTDTPVLPEGAYRFAVAIETARGSRDSARILYIDKGTTTRIALSW